MAHGTDVEFLRNFADKGRVRDGQAVVVDADRVRADLSRAKLGRESVARPVRDLDR